MFVTSKVSGLVQIPVGKGRPLVQLQPGSNEVSGAEWSLAKSIKLIKALITAGKLVEHEQESLKDVDAARAVALVRDTFNKSLLEKWSSERLSETVLTAIAEQRKVLNDADKKRAEEKQKKNG